MVLILLALINITGCDEDSLVSFDGIGYAVVDTGQATCYDNSELIDCPAEGESFYGQDAQYSHRPDILQSEVGIQQAEAQVKIARSRFYPNLNLWAGYEGTHIDNLRLEEDDYGASVGLSLSFNLFSGGPDRARVKEARLRTVELEKSMENLKITVSAEVRDSVTQLLSAQEQLRLQRSNLRLVKRNRDLVEREYTAGQASLVRLNEAQRDLVTAQGRLALALATLRQARFNLETDTGHILEGLAVTYR